MRSPLNLIIYETDPFYKPLWTFRHLINKILSTGRVRLLKDIAAKEPYALYEIDR